MTPLGRPSGLRILYFTKFYPAFSQTYLEVERRYLESHHDTTLIAFGTYGLRPRTHHSYHCVDRDKPDDWVRVARAFAPDIVHGYFLTHIEATRELARRLDRPFTMRLHSTDVISLSGPRLAGTVECINDALCLGALVFPFLRAGLERAGAHSEKLIDAWPVVDYGRFHDTGPNGDGVMGVGSSVPKKDFGSFIRMAAEVPSRPFHLYALNYDADEMRRLEAVSRNLGAPATFFGPVEHADMPAEYKKHAWLLYTAVPGAPVGWPTAVLEAQASGVGVCVRRIRPDLEDFLGNTGILFDTYDEIRDVLAGPVPEDMRARGFENARKGAIDNQISVLEGMWGHTGAAPVRKEHIETDAKG